MGLTQSVSAESSQEGQSVPSSEQMADVEHYLRSFVEYAPVAIAMLDQDMRYLIVSRCWQEQWGMSDRDLIGQHHTDVFSNLPHHWQGIYQRCLTAGIDHSIEEPYVRPDGGIDWLRWTVRPWRDQAGTVGGLMLFTEVITDPQFLQSIWDGVDYGIFILDVLDGGEEFRFARFNPTMYKVTPIPAEFLAGKTVAEALPPDMAPIYRQRYRSCLQTGQSVVFEERFVVDGQESWWMVNLNPLRNQQGEMNQIVATATNISHRKAAEAALQKEREFLKALLDNLADGIVVCDEDGILTLFNRATREFHGLPEAYLPPDQWADHFALYQADAKTLMPTEDIPLFRAFKGELVRNSEMVIAPKQGQPRTLLASGQAFFDTEGNKLGAVVVMRDVTDRKRSEERLRDREQFLRTVYEGSEHVIFVVDIDDGETFRMAGWNGACERATGLSNKDVVGKTLDQLHGSTQAKIIQQRYEQCVAAGTPLNYEECLTLQGEESWWMTTLNPLQDSEGKVYRLVGTTLDITERKRAEQTLQESQQFIQSLADSSPNLLYIYDLIGQRNIYANCELTDVLGYSTEYLQQLGDNLLAKIIHPEDWDRVVQHHQTLSTWADGEVRELEYRMQRVDGKWLWLNSRETVFKRDADGNVIQLVGSAQDITDRKQAEQQLQEQASREQLLNQLTNQIRNSLDFDQILNTTVQEIQALLQVDRCHFAWYTVEQDGTYWDVTSEVQAPGLPSFVGRHPVSVFGPLSASVLRREILRLDDVAQVSSPEVREFVQGLGNQSMLVLPVSAKSGEFGIIACIHSRAVRPWTDEEVDLLEAVVAQLAIALNQADLYTQSRTKARELEQTMQELRRTQTQMVQSEKMSSLGQLVAGVAHEINNPVNFIHGNLSHANDYTQDVLRLLELYDEHYPHPVPAVQDEIEAIDLDFLKEDLPKLLNSMKVGTDRIRQIVLSLRNFSRMDEAEMKAVDIHEGIDSTLMILHNRLKSKSDCPEIEVMKEYGELPLVECYAGQLNQVFMNLISNAIDALEEQRRVDSSFEPILTICTQRMDQNQVMIAIADNGPGVSNPIKERIFDPFFTTKPIGKGTGMGLSISYQIVTEKHSGALECISEPSQGTTFQITIPVRQ